MRLNTIMAALATGGILIGSACAPDAGSNPSATTAKSASAPTQESAAASSAINPDQSPDWRVNWDNLVAAAKKEGRIVVAGSSGEAQRNAAMAFQRAYPEIHLEYTALTPSDFAPRILAEREGGQYLWDVQMGGATTGLTVLRPRGALDPLQPALVLPEVLDDSKWLAGFNECWMDNEKKFIFNFEAGFLPTFLVNRAMVPESELNTIDQLLDPKWKGRIVSGDPRVANTTNGNITVLFLVKGQDWLRKFLAQELVIMDERAVIESVVRGRYPIMLSVSASMLALYKTGDLKDVMKNVKPLDPEGAAGASLNSGSGNVTLINKAPHPNAAKVFINWLLSKEGQQGYVDAVSVNSRRLDVEGRDVYTPNPKIKYVHSTKEEILPVKEQATQLAKEMIK